MQMLYKGSIRKSRVRFKICKSSKATLLEQINKTTIKAPFNGVVTAKLTEEGAFAAPGSIASNYRYFSLKFTVNVPENDLSSFQLNQTFSINADAYSDVAIVG